MFGVLIKQAPEDWKIIQQIDGYGEFEVTGEWSVHPDALNVGVKQARPMVRVVREENNEPMIDWMEAEHTTDKSYWGGQFSITLKVPAGGLYRLETGVDTVSTMEGVTWLFRGDDRFHLGVGDVFLISGQSNASGFAMDAAEDGPDLMVHALRNNGHWDLAAHPLNEGTEIEEGNLNIERRVTGTSPFLSFGKEVAARTGYPVGLIVCTLGGMPISCWEENGFMMKSLLNKTRKESRHFAGFLWYQGCADADGGTCDVYEEKQKQFLSRVRKYFGENLPVFFFQLNREQGERDDKAWGIVREAQRRVADTKQNIYIMSTLDAKVCDSVHNNSRSNVMLGKRMAKLYTQVLRKEAPELPGNLISAYAVKKDIQLTFENIKGNIQFDLKEADRMFTVEKDGKVQNIEKVEINQNGILLTMEEEVGECDTVSYAWQAWPTQKPAIDSITRLPILSFYQIKVKNQLQ